MASGLSVEGRYSDHSSVCRRAELSGRSVKAKKVRKADGSLVRSNLKTKQRQFVFEPQTERSSLPQISAQRGSQNSESFVSFVVHSCFLFGFAQIVL